LVRRSHAHPAACHHHSNHSSGGRSHSGSVRIRNIRGGSARAKHARWGIHGSQQSEHYVPRL